MKTPNVQPGLWDQPKPIRRRRRSTAPTQSDAYEDSRAGANRGQRRVLDALRARGPMTRNEIAEVIGLPLSSVCARVNELVKQGLVVEMVADGRIVKRDGRRVVAAAFHTQQRAG